MGNVKPVIVAVAYNRIDALKRLLQSVENADYEDEEITLIISIDYGGGKEIIKFAENFSWSHGPKIVKTYSENQGLKKHIIQCGDYSIEYGAAIILEDDLMVSPCFYKYVKQALEYYKDEDKVFGIALYSQRWNGYANRTFEPLHDGNDVYFSQVACSWGQCYTKEQWEGFRKWFAEKEHNLNDSVDVPYVVTTWKRSQGKYIAYYIAEQNKYFLTPYESLSTNFHDAGTHIAVANSTYQVPLLWKKQNFKFGCFKNSIKYDNYFESVELKKYLTKKYPNKTICMDFYGIHRDREKYDLCLCSATLPYKVIKMWGLKMRPYEFNCINEINGEDIFLYDMNQMVLGKKNREKKIHHYNWIKYEVKDLSWIDGLFYTGYVLFMNFKYKFMRR